MYRSCLPVLILRHLKPHGPNLIYYTIEVGGDTFQDMHLKLTFSERKLEELSENVYFWRFWTIKFRHNMCKKPGLPLSRQYEIP